MYILSKKKTHFVTNVFSPLLTKPNLRLPNLSLKLFMKNVNLF
jgi:hypothetical protein